MFITHGPLPPDSPLFVGREKELETLSGWIAQTKCVGAVYGARQTGKTSFLLRLRHIQQKKYGFYFVNLESIPDASAAETFSFIYGVIFEQCRFKQKLATHESPTTGLAFRHFLRDLAGDSPDVKSVILIDEIGAISPEGASKLAHVIRSIFTERHIQYEFAKLVFVLSGSTDLLALSTGLSSPLQNVTESIYLSDLSRNETRELVCAGYDDPDSKRLKQLADELYAWTHGHPYLTQYVCATIVDRHHQNTEGGTDRFVRKLLKLEDRNLPHLIRGLNQGDQNQIEILQRLMKGAQIAFSRNDLRLVELELVGAIRVEAGLCLIRNTIYEHVFGQHYGSKKSSDPRVPNHLTREQIDELSSIGARYKMGDSARDILFAFVNQGFYSGLDKCTNPRDQVRSDLLKMNAVSQLNDGSCPLQNWLTAAVSRLQSSSVADLRPFEHALNQVNSKIESGELK